MTPGQQRQVETLTFTPSYFEDMYEGTPDPWGFDTAWYEQRKYELTIAALPRPRFRRALEPGCSNGALTEMLAARCDNIVAFDFITSAVDTARQRLAGLDNVVVAEATFPTFWPAGHGDLVVWSEVAYYLTDTGAKLALRSLDRWLAADGHLVSVHYTGPTNYPRAGGDIVPWLDSCHFLNRITHLTDPDFELGVWSRRPSV